MRKTRKFTQNLLKTDGATIFAFSMTEIVNFQCFGENLSYHQNMNFKL